ncbi:MAG: hypothetical protein D6820_16730 [Lentisphaerae bacterium]|nr:MAG: hypothetical protein D6820_16730 [Lentisphaerota bacterium]
METPFRYGCLIRVRDINRARAFYRDALELGDPIVDSNFWLEFKIAPDAVLAIEHSPAAQNGEKKTWDASCIIEKKEFDLFLRTLEARGIQVIRPSRELPGRRTISIVDPEDNIITIVESIPDDPVAGS